MLAKGFMKKIMVRNRRLLSTTPFHPKTAIIMSGCGVYDGAEITETVAMIVSLSKHGAKVDYFAPDMEQYHVVNHTTGEEMDEKRNVLVESARITRGNIKELGELDVDKYDAIFFPGGFGAAKNLCTYAIEGSEMGVLPDVANILRRAKDSNVNIGMACISPIIAAKVRYIGLVIGAWKRVRWERSDTYSGRYKH